MFERSCFNRQTVSQSIAPSDQKTMCQRKVGCVLAVRSENLHRTQNLLRMEHCAFLEAIRFFRKVGCERHKLQFRTVQQNQKSFPWMQDWGWMVSPHLIYGIWSSQFLETRIRVIKKRRNPRTNVREVRSTPHTIQNESNLIEWSMIWIMLILFPRTSHLLIRKLVCMCFKKKKQWSRCS